MKRNSPHDLTSKYNSKIIPLSNRPPHDLTRKYRIKNLSSNRSGQVASTLTWFVATIVVFFIMILFTSACVLLAGERKVFGGFANIEVSGTENSFIAKEVLGSLLSKPAVINGKTEDMRELIYTWAFENEGEKKDNLAKNIKDEVGKSLGIYGESCYTLFLEHESVPTRSLLVASNQFEDNEIIFSQGERVDEVLKDATRFSIYEKGKQINGRFYLGTC